MRIKYAESNGGRWFYYIQTLRGWSIFQYWKTLTYQEEIEGVGRLTRPVKFDTCQEADQYVISFQSKISKLTHD